MFVLLMPLPLSRQLGTCFFHVVYVTWSDIDSLRGRLEVLCDNLCYTVEEGCNPCSVIVNLPSEAWLATFWI